MPEMISLRKFRLATLTGFVTIFEPNTPKFVPDNAVAAAMAEGCVPVDAADTPFHENLARTTVDFTGGVRASMLFLAIKDVVKGNKPKDFDGSGVPNVPALEHRLGFDVSRSEIAAIYKQFQQCEAEGTEYALAPNAPNIMRVIEASNRAELEELAEEFGFAKDKTKGLVVKDLRKLLLVSFDGNAAD